MIIHNISDKKEVDMTNKFNILNKGDVSIMSKINYIKRGAKYIIGVGAMIAGFSSAAFGLTEENGYYLIKGGQDLIDFAQLVNSGKETSARGILKNNITFNDPETVENAIGGELEDEKINIWTPIGTKENPFLGELISDDGVKEIIGLYVRGKESDYQGFFGCVEKKGEIRNIVVNNSYIEGKDCVGAIAGWNYGKISNCSTNNTIVGNNYVGGNVGKNYGILESCYNNGEIWGTGEGIGGNVGVNYGIISGKNINDATVLGEKNIGGNVGKNVNEIDGIKYEGMIEGYCYNKKEVTGKYNLGGNVGFNEATIKAICENIGDISMNEGENTGGNVGYNTGSIMEHFLNIGNVNGQHSVGGNVGFNDGGIEAKCENKGNITGESFVGGNIGVNKNENIKEEILTNNGKAIQNGKDIDKKIGSL